MPYTNVFTNPAYWKTLLQKPRYTDTHIPDLTGKVAIVTGANTGLGYETTLALASHGAHVILACRSEAKALQAIQQAKSDIRTRIQARNAEREKEWAKKDKKEQRRSAHQQREGDHLGRTASTATTASTFSTVSTLKEGAPVVVTEDKASHAAKADADADKKDDFWGPTSPTLDNHHVFDGTTLDDSVGGAPATRFAWEEESYQPRLDFLELDLNDMNKCHKAALEFLSKGLPLHILVNNGGIMASPFGLSADGIENQFAVNHMGHFVFTVGLLEKIRESQPSRIVVLSSVGHEGSVRGGVDFDTLNDKSASDTTTRYGRSKLANILFGKALARRLAKDKVYVNMAHPGFVYTDLQRNTKESLGSLASCTYDLAGRMCAAKPEVGALNQIYLATSPEIEERDVRGKYFIPVANEFRPSPYALDEVLQEKLWMFSEKLMAEKVHEP